MTVYFIGAGPGAPDLITVRGADLLARCGACLYAGSLVPTELLARCPEGATLIDTARMPLSDIVGHIVRLHSGDLSLYSALAEQLRALDDLDIDYELVPGVPAFAAAAAALGRELTVPEVGQSLLITRVSTMSTDMPAGEELSRLADTGVTLALHLSAHRAAEITAVLVPRYGAACPTAVVAFASRAQQQIIRCRLAELPEQMRVAGIVRTAVIFVGPVLAATGFVDSYLYSQARMVKLESNAAT
jgi:precorrin-4/cobalt-precorrin-4 C11-methyltransferase